MNNPTNIQFDSDQTSAMTAIYNKERHDSGEGRSVIARFLIRKGIVKNEKTATYLLTGFLVVVLLFTFYLFYKIVKKPTLNTIVKHQAIKQK